MNNITVETGYGKVKKVWDFPVVDDNKLISLLHLHPAMKALLGG